MEGKSVDIQIVGASIKIGGVTFENEEAVVYCCDNIPIDKKPCLFGIINATWNDGQRIRGKITISPRIIFTSDDGSIEWIVTESSARKIKKAE